MSSRAFPSLIEAPEALALGLLNEVVPDVETLQRRAAETAKLVAGHAPITMETAKAEADVLYQLGANVPPSAATRHGPTTCGPPFFR